MKGKVYSGIIYLPNHPHADMHGQLRCIVRTEGGMMHLASILRAYDIPFSPMLFNLGTWCESKSTIEQSVSEKFYGVAIVCPTWCQYLRPDNYRAIPESLKVGKRDNQEATAEMEKQS